MVPRMIGLVGLCEKSYTRVEAPKIASRAAPEAAEPTAEPMRHSALSRTALNIATLPELSSSWVEPLLRPNCPAHRRRQPLHCHPA